MLDTLMPQFLKKVEDHFMHLRICCPSIFLPQFDSDSTYKFKEFDINKIKVPLFVFSIFKICHFRYIENSLHFWNELGAIEGVIIEWVE